MTLPKYIYIILGFVGLVLVANLVLLDFFVVQQGGQVTDLQTTSRTLSDSIKVLGNRMFGTVDNGSSQAGSEASSSGTTTNSFGPQVVNVCPDSCISAMESATAAARTSTASLLSTVSQTVTQTTKGEFFVPLGGGTVSNSEASSGQNWKTLESSQATFDAGSYGTIKQAYFEVSMYIPQPSGELHARLLDTTTPAIFWNTDFKATSGTSQFFSAPITLTSGQKTYKVQMYTTMTPGTLDFARIRIVVQ